MSYVITRAKRIRPVVVESSEAFDTESNTARTTVAGKPSEPFSDLTMSLIQHAVLASMFALLGLFDPLYITTVMAIPVSIAALAAPWKLRGELADMKHFPKFASLVSTLAGLMGLMVSVSMLALVAVYFLGSPSLVETCGLRGAAGPSLFWWWA